MLRSFCFVRCSVHALREKERHEKMTVSSDGPPLITFEDFQRFQRLVAYNLENVERALTMFGKAADADSAHNAGTSARFGM